jgi:transposase
MTTEAPALSAPPPKPIGAYLGWDWADKKHDLYLRLPGQTSGTHQVIDNTPEVLHPFLSELHQRFLNQRVAVCLEASSAALLPIFGQYQEWLVVYLLNPKTLAKYREAFRPSGAKNDRLDCELCADIVMSHPEQLHIWQPLDCATAELARLSEDRRKLVDLRTLFANQLKSHLKSYFPQAIVLLDDDLTTALASALVRKWPTLTALQKAGPAQIRRFFLAHGCRATEGFEERLAQVAKAKAVTEQVEWLVPQIRYANAIAGQLSVLHPAIAKYDELIVLRSKAHPSYEVVAHLPGAGPVFKARLLSVLGGLPERFENAEDFAVQIGIAPIQRQSGGSCITQRRHACSVFIHQTFVEFAKSSTFTCPWAADFMKAKKERGWKYYRAVRALAFKWSRILYALMRTGSAYNEAIYLAALKKKNSPYKLKEEAAN